MVKNNEIPIEVKKPYETVYEIKNEIPTFEEFMKDYKTDENLNYDDLSVGSVGEVKGYGPCNYKNDYCTCYCGRDDYRCNCLYEERWCNLRLACPVCPRDSSNYPREWGHSGHVCLGARISNKGRIRCNKTNCRTDEIRYWKFKCSKHDGETSDSSESFTLAVLTAINVKDATGNSADEKLMRELMVHLENNSWRNR